MRFKLTGKSYDKTLEIQGFDSLNISIDNDDVDHKEVREEAQKLVDLLNKEWS